MKLHPWFAAALALLCLAAPARAISVTNVQGDGETWFGYRVWKWTEQTMDTASTPGVTVTLRDPDRPDNPGGWGNEVILAGFPDAFRFSVSKSVEAGTKYFATFGDPHTPNVKHFGIYHAADYYDVRWGDRPANVPDASATLPMLALGLLGLALPRLWRTLHS